MLTVPRSTRCGAFSGQFSIWPGSRSTTCAWASYQGRRVYRPRHRTGRCLRDAPAGQTAQCSIDVDTLAVGDLDQPLPWQVRVIIDLRIRRGDQNAGLMLRHRRNRKPGRDFGEHPIDQLDSGGRPSRHCAGSATARRARSPRSPGDRRDCRSRPRATPGWSRGRRS